MLSSSALILILNKNQIFGSVTMFAFCGASENAAINEVWGADMRSPFLDSF